MKRSTTLLLLFMCICHLSITAQTWLGNSNNWSDPNNWNTAAVPVAADDVVIPSTSNDPVISATVANVASIEIQSGAKLTIASGGTITIDQETGTGYGINVVGGTLDVQGQLNIHPIAGETVNGIQIVGTLRVSGNIDFSETAGGDIRMCVDNDSSGPATITITFSGEMVATGVENELFELNSGNSIATVTNNGTLRYIDGENEIIRLDDADVFINNGLIEANRINNTEDEAIEVGNDVTFTNNGIIRLDNYNMGIDLDDSGATFTNNGRIEITNTGSESIQVNSGNTFVNNNSVSAAILLDNSLDINGTFTNSGYMMLGIGTLDVSGTFENTSTGYICDPNDLVANAIVTGTLTDNGTVETGTCAPPPPLPVAIPTLGQWGLIILGLVILTFGIIGIKERYRTLGFN